MQDQDSELMKCETIKLLEQLSKLGEYYLDEVSHSYVQIRYKKDPAIIVSPYQYKRVLFQVDSDYTLGLYHNSTRVSTRGLKSPKTIHNAVLDMVRVKEEEIAQMDPEKKYSARKGELHLLKRAKFSDLTTKYYEHSFSRDKDPLIEDFLNFFTHNFKKTRDIVLKPGMSLNIDYQVRQWFEDLTKRAGI